MEKVFKWLAVLGRLGNLYADQRLKELGINSSHHPFIIHVCTDPGITQESLRNKVYIHPSNITRSLDYLEKKGFIRKEPLADDKRTCRLYPTEKALNCYDYIIETINNWADIITKDIPENKKDEFLHYVELAGKSAAEYFYPCD